MKYIRKPVAVDAFKFETDSEVNAPAWFIKAVRNELIFIDRCIIDGAVHVYGCTINYKRNRLSARIGDYIIKDHLGNIRPCKAKEFRKSYERVEDDGD
jgi:hypothetical protein